MIHDLLVQDGLVGVAVERRHGEVRQEVEEQEEKLGRLLQQTMWRVCQAVNE